MTTLFVSESSLPRIPGPYPEVRLPYYSPQPFSQGALGQEPQQCFIHISTSPRTSLSPQRASATRRPTGSNAAARPRPATGICWTSSQAWLRRGERPSPLGRREKRPRPVPRPIGPGRQKSWGNQSRTHHGASEKAGVLGHGVSERGTFHGAKPQNPLGQGGLPVRRLGAI